MKKHLLSILAITSVASINAQIQGYTVGQTVTDFTVIDTDGNSHNLYTYTSQGKYVILDFFFDTCPPCQATSPHFSELHEKYGCNQGDIICIAMNNGSDNDAMVIAYENTYGGTHAHPPAISNDGGAGLVDTDLNPAAYPTYCIIGSDNTLKHADIWPVNSIADFENAFSSISFSPAVMSCALDVSENELSSDIHIYPNPASADLNVEYTSTVSNVVTLEIYNIVGKKLSSQTYSAHTGSNMINLNVADYENGQYIIQFVTREGVSDRNTFQIIK